ncbi:MULTISPECIES: hypothetical protein [Streptomyces]|uniref:Uncharacterized protein n=1 Tax=Streptomyces venezuelae (strain ATCC 10712 / CBS 650.69 / DSM 40230 / JCM 4526 / NBRC 13096 / PD 04745) TaxID=953739 RepID=F2RKY5_STRVP|nr:hypothetical protein [Streptomyces venezuelae]APE21355.1 hypothetical protein vnz_10210 [Streptomyces venezuelae]QER98745.1 hypothetical protein DEJ43_10335 [Streptomyces venezuelae ATCC 10712]CCA55374.1 hypothetical protein SVEN_2088 [Streptomyces venezuelae ATCC 10712]
MIPGIRVGHGAREHIAISTTLTFADGLDLIAVERVVNGGNADLTDAEKAEAGRRLQARDVPQAEISRRIGLSLSTVQAWAKNGWVVPSSSVETAPLDIGNASHGRSGYTKGCRCLRCRTGARDAARQRRAAKRQQTAA